ncbi:hypothetical protein Vadar_027262 [Vaccinium darrowii]|uniref:Uncharacterized protein n=1 Tax=Vaccinium darrowii TaxID=229202 RepID=A0ACB7YZB7_9ERIC|nr:hypothetical protein Vadar_027262 [Vaccinium darrowii]
MARGKGKARSSEKLSKEMAVEKPSKRRRQNSDSESSSGDDSGAEQVSRRTHEEVIGDRRRKWLAAFPKKKAKNERQLNEADLGTDLGVKEIHQEGLQQWFEPVPGFNLKCVKEFYTTIRVEKEGDEPVKIKAKVAGKMIQITPDHIAEHLKYTRPDPETVSEERSWTKQEIKDFLYEDPSGELEPIKPGRFQDDIRILNKAIHVNLYPKGKASAPTIKSLGVMTSFVDEDTKVDWAHFIFLQMVDYLDTPVGPTMFWFPCMITAICHKQGVKGTGYTRMDPCDRGLIDSTTLEKSKAQAKNQTPQVAKAAPSSKPGASSSTVPPPLPMAKPMLLVPPSESSKATVGYKKLYKLMAKVFKKLEKIERKQKLDDHFKKWEQKVLENLSGQRYEIPPELVVDDSGDEEEEEDDSDDEE